MSGTDPAAQAFHHWSIAAPAWEQHRQRLFEAARPVSERLVEQVDPRPGQTVLELTGGPGETGFLAAPLLEPGGTLISSDFVPAMVDVARRGASARGLGNVEARVIDAIDIDLPDGSVDGVLSRFGLMLIPDQASAFGEIRRVLRPGCRCAYACWGPPDRNPWLFLLVLALLQHGYAPPGDPMAPGWVFSLSTYERNRELVAGAGFDLVAIEELSGVMSFVDVDEYWSINTAAAGPLAELVAGLTPDERRAVRATLDELVAPFNHDGGLALPWVSVVVTAA